MTFLKTDFRRTPGFDRVPGVSITDLQPISDPEATRTRTALHAAHHATLHAALSPTALPVGHD